jgi:hypothetical protein
VPLPAINLPLCPAGASDYIENATSIIAGNYTLLSSGLYISSGSVLITLCALRSSPLQSIPNTWNVYFGTSDFPLSICALMGVRNDLTRSRDLLFNISELPITCPPAGEPSQVRVEDFNPVTPNVRNNCPADGPKMPEAMLGSGFADDAILPFIPFPLPIALSSEVTITESSIVSSFIQGALFATLCPLSVATLPENVLNATQPPLVAGVQLVFGEASLDPAYLICAWISRGTEGHMFVSAGDPGAPCPTDFSNNVTVYDFYPPTSGAMSAVTSTLALLAAVVAVFLSSKPAEA